MIESKSLGNEDKSGFLFCQELLDGGLNYGFNFDRLCYDYEAGKFIVFEFLKVDQWQTVTPWESHPVRYWHKNWRKFVAIWRGVQKLEADFYCVNYAEAGTPFADQVRVLQIFSMNKSGIKKWSDWKCSRGEFTEFFRQINLRCRENEPCPK